MTAVAALTDLC